MRRTNGWRRGRPPVRNRRNDALAQLDPLEFERVVADYYHRQGYRVEHCGTGGGGRRFDGGIDLKLYRDGEYTVVQCKRENALQVTHNVGHELLGILATEKADKAIVVNAGEFTGYARETAARDPRLQLIDGDRLREMLPEYARAGREATELGAASRTGQGAGRAASTVGWRDWSLSAPKTRPVPLRVTESPSRRRKRPDLIARAAIGAVMLLLAFAMLHQIKTIVLNATAPEPAQRQRAVPTAPAVRVVGSSQPVLEKARSGGRALVVPTHKYTDDERRRQQRRAAEAIRVIEATTPEM